MTRYWGRERNYDLDGYQPAGIPAWLGYFEWVVGFEYGWANTEVRPTSVFCEPTYAGPLAKFLSKTWTPRRADGQSLVVFGGSDARLSEMSSRSLGVIRKYFSDVYFEAFDEARRGVQIMPIGLTEHYVRGNSDLVLQLASTLDRTPRPTSEDPTVLAAWGAWWPGLDELIPDRQHARAFSTSSEVVTQASLSSDEWFEALADFDYVMCPLGNGVQAPKVVEAVLMGCIPIVTDHLAFRELDRRGFPLLIVERWDQISPRLLRDEYTRLFERVARFRTKALDLNEWWKFSFPGWSGEPPSPHWLGTATEDGPKLGA